MTDDIILPHEDGTPGTITQKRRHEILHSLGGVVCGACVGQKRPKMSHCRRCYYALTPAMRQALYSGFGDGYEEAYEASLVYLARKAR